jgi:integrase/recombinase XerD
VPKSVAEKPIPGQQKRAGLKRRLPRSLTAEECRALLVQPSARYPTGVRNRALMATMLHAGLRCSEALSLRPADIDLSRFLIRVVADKGDKDRTVPIDPTLEVYLREWRYRRPSGSRFFSTLKGKPLDTRYVRRMVHRYGAQAGIAAGVHPHLLRHTCATTWLNDRGLSIKRVQLLLGHARLATTERYLHASVPDLVPIFRSFT